MRLVSLKSVKRTTRAVMRWGDKAGSTKATLQRSSLGSCAIGCRSLRTHRTQIQWRLPSEVNQAIHISLAVHLVLLDTYFFLESRWLL